MSPQATDERNVRHTECAVCECMIANGSGGWVSIEEYDAEVLKRRQAEHERDAAIEAAARLRAGLLTIATGGAKWPVGHAALILYGEEPTPPDVACEHEWVSARNEAVMSGEICKRCFAVRAEGTDVGGGT